LLFLCGVLEVRRGIPVSARPKVGTEREAVKLAIIDLGSNSVRFDVYEIDSLHRVRRILREKIMVRLGDGVFESGRFNRHSVARTVKAFQHFEGLIERLGVDRVMAFATAALRDADDAKPLLDRILRETGIKLKVISGKEEARLIAKGILNNERPPTGVYALVDIGGGSTEISVCYKRTCVDSHSFDLGANRLQQVFLQSSPPGKRILRGSEPERVIALRRHIRRVLGRQITQRQWPSVRAVMGSSGTVRAIRKILRKLEGDQAYPIRRRTLSALVQVMIPMTGKELLDLPGMEPKRVDQILAGAILLEEILLAMRAQYLLITPFSLRDGVLEQEMERLALSGRGRAGRA
jgi:exopolyphosphatase/guanosine-5'-triphosphate,3'-diphosphate pyrophosphatase